MKLLEFSELKDRFLRIFLMLLALLGIYFFLRLGFYFFNQNLFKDSVSAEVIEAFIMGLRFDASALLLINLAFVLSVLILSQKFFTHIVFKVATYFFAILNSLFAGINIVDWEFFNFNGKRMSSDILKISQDVQNQGPQLLLYYWPLSLFFLAASVLIIFLFYRLFLRAPKEGADPLAVNASQKLASLALIFSFVLISVVGIRGGLQLKPLHISHAYTFSQNQLGVLALNTSFTFIRSGKERKLRPLKYFASSMALAQALPPLPEVDKPLWHPSQPQNLVFILLESFSLEYVGYANKGEGYTPFLDELAAKSLVFNQHFSNGRRSIQALPSLLAGLPNLMDEPFVTSPYATTELQGLGQILKGKGYQTSFFHGAQKGSMFFDSFSRRMGFDRYYGLEDYPRPEDNDGIWGIYDEPFLQFAVEKLNAEKSPFAALIFTLSSHQPYLLPDEYKGKFRRGTLEIHPSIQYTDMALRKFFAEAEKQSWYANTVFVITADHTQKMEKAFYRNPLGAYRVPLLFYWPRGIPFRVDTKRVSQHSDLPMSLLDALGMSVQMQLPFGRSIFRAPELGRVVNFADGTYWYVTNTHFLQYRSDQDFQLFLIEDVGQKQPLDLRKPENLDAAQALIRELKAQLQTYNEGLLTNRWQQNN